MIRAVKSKVNVLLNETYGSITADAGEAYQKFSAVKDDENTEEEPVEEPEEKGEESMDIMAFVDDIRKKSLKGMASLAETPDDERYQLLKKIWQICDKKPEQQTAFGNPANAQPQQGQMQGQMMQQNPQIR